MTQSDRSSRPPLHAPDSPPDRESRGIADSHEPPTVQEPASIHVLFVDDSAAVRESATACLSAAGYSVTQATNGFEALARVVQCLPDIVFADTAMPGLDGYQMCALIKSNSDYRHIPVIMVTGRDGILDKARVKLVGSEAHVSRPLTTQTLSAAVRTATHSGLGVEKLAHPA